MTNETTEERFGEQIVVSRRMVEQAKSFLLRMSTSVIRPTDLTDSFARAQGHEKIEQLDIDREDQVAEAAAYHSSVLALTQATSELISSGILLPIDSGTHVNTVEQQWTRTQG